MGRLPGSLLVSILAAAPWAARAADPAPAAAPADPAPAAAAPGEALSLVCTGVYRDPQGAAPERQTQFTLRLSYVDRSAQLKAAEWPALTPARDDPSVVRSVRFEYDDDTVRAMFPSGGNELRGALDSIGLTKLAGDYKGVIVLERKTGRFSYPNTSGQCEKAAAPANKF
jgi:hypothetical protein